MGRHKSDNPKSTRIEMRVTPKEKETIMNFAKEHSVSLLELLKLGIEALKKR